jgi:hypothetical protein
MNLRKKVFVLSLILGIAFIWSCEKFERSENETLISTHGEEESHHRNENCMNCHYSAGSDAEGWFTLAGSAAGNSQNAFVELYTGPNGTGTLVKSIEIDGRSNFYTTETVDFSNGLYAGIRRGSNIEYDPGILYHGQCNLCHGSTEEPLYVNW